METNKPVTNPRLVAAMKEARMDNTEEAGRRLIEEVKKASLIVPARVTPTPAAEGKVVFDQNTRVDFPTLESPAHEKFLPVFTDWDMVRQWRKNEGEQALIMSVRELSNVILGGDPGLEGLAINPFCENLIFTRRMLPQFLEES